MRPPSTLVIALALSAHAVAGCSDDSTPSHGAGTTSTTTGAGGGGGASAGCPAAGATECVGAELRTCVDEGGALAWGAAEACPGEQHCHEGACVDPTASQLSQVATLETFVDQVADNTGWSLPLDRDAIKKEGRTAIVKGDGGDGFFFAAMRGAHLALQQGHQSLYLADPGACETPAMPYQNSSRFGVCGRPRGDTIVVTFARPGNGLGLSVGDVVVGLDDVTGPQLLEDAAARPVCGVISPAPSGKRSSAAASFFGTVPEGAKLVVEAAEGGGQYTVPVPPGDGQWTNCQDALGRDIDFNAQATVRPDGIAVIRLPRFYPIDQTLPPNPTPAEVQQFIDEFQAKIVAEFDKVKDAPGIVWDARGNYGGISLVGLAIAAGMPTAVATNVSYCTARIPKSDPPDFYPDHYAVYDVTPGGPFAYTGKVAVLVDGLDYSAADYFPLGIRKATQTPIVGEASAGAYGGPGAMIDLTGPPPMLFDYDVNRCVDADTGEPLEGKATKPDVEVEYDPADLVAGVDTLLEAAVALVK